MDRIVITWRQFRARRRCVTAGECFNAAMVGALVGLLLSLGVK